MYAIITILALCATYSLMSFLDLATDPKYAHSRRCSITSLLPSNALIPDPIDLKFQWKIGISHMYEGVQPDFRLTLLGVIIRFTFGKFGRWYSFICGQKSTRFSLLTANEQMAMILKDTFTD